MNLQRYGGIALFVNLALSLIFCFWAIAVWANPVNFEAEKKQRDEIISTLSKLVQPGEQKLQSTRIELTNIVARRPQLQALYAQELENLRTGKGPVQAVVIVKGDVQLDAQGRPVLGPILDSSNQPIAVQGSLSVLDEKYKTTEATIKKVLQDTDSTVKEIAKLTEQIGDGKEPAAGMPAGLRYQWASWQLAEKRSLNEQEFVKPLLYNRMVELDILSKRNKALTARLSEIEGAAVTQKQ
jgi:hypothetical protein